MRGFVAKLGLYQSVVLVSRGLGLLRDALILVLLGATVLADDVYFLLGFVDLITMTIAGGGAVLFLSIQYKNNESQSYYSAIIFYLIIALLFVTFEFFTSGFIGGFIYLPLRSSEAALSGYYIILTGLLFTLPLVASYGCFLRTEQLYLQPLMNIIYSAFAIVALIFFYANENFDIIYFTLFLLFGTILRLFFASVLAYKSNLDLKFRKVLRKDLSFYFKLLTSGLAIGLIFAIPFIFRGGLPLFGEGVYSTSSFTFKINDLLVTLLLIPVTSMLLSSYELRGRTLIALLLVCLLLPLLTLSSYYLAVEYIPQIKRLTLENKIDIRIVELSLYTLVFTSVIYILGMILVKIDAAIVLIVFSVLVIVILKSSFLTDGIKTVDEYFYFLYKTYFGFIIALVGFLLLKLKFSKGI